MLIGITRLSVPLILTAALSAAPPCRAKGSADRVPAGASVLLTLDVKEGDAGQKWVFDSLTRFLLSRAGRAKDDARIDDVKLFRLDDISLALFPRKGRKKPDMLLGATLLPSDGSFSISYGDVPLRLNVRDRETADSTQRGMLSFLLSAACEVPPGEKPPDGVLFNPASEKSSRLSAFHVGKESAFLASNSRLVRSALKDKKVLSSTEDYRKTMALLPEGWDAYGYAHRGGAPFTPEPGEGWELFIAALLEGVESVGLAIDVQDPDSSRLVLALAPEKEGGVAELRKRLEPQLPLLVKKLLDGRIKSRIEFEETPAALKVNARLRNTRPFWEKIFHNKSAR